MIVFNRDLLLLGGHFQVSCSTSGGVSFHACYDYGCSPGLRNLVAWLLGEVLPFSKEICGLPYPGTRWARVAKWSYNLDKWPYKLVTGVLTPVSGVITLFITGRGW